MAELRSVPFQDGNQSVDIMDHRDGGGGMSRSDTSERLCDKEKSHEIRKNERNSNEVKKVNYEGPAVVVRHACKHFQKGVPVLQDMNMTVQKGAIYSLLGSSGVGKTTTLACIVGVRKLNEGYVYVFGAKPGVKGKSVGYMPQETSLYEDFSIAETLSYFGTLCGLNRREAFEKTTFLKELLRLPDVSQRVGTLSGGQRRRVSFAVALVADPQLLVLDEPTVGVDPLLRESIWRHLVHLSTDCGTTVLITTHYIDEAKESNAVGVMRYGRLLCEENPAILLNAFNTTSLESVVLQLCRKDGRSDDECAENNDNSTTDQLELARLPCNVVSPPDDSEFVPPSDNEDTVTKIMDSAVRIKSLIYKNLAVLFRNILLFFFSVFMPAIVVYVVCISFQNNPKNLRFGVVNYEVNELNFCNNLKLSPPGECDTEYLSCKFIRNIRADTFGLINYKNETEAVADVHEGAIWGYMIFPEEYSSCFYERSAGGADIDIGIVNKSEIIVKMDQTNQVVVNTAIKSLLEGFEDYAKAILRDCGFDERQAEYSLKFQTPIFGGDHVRFVEFIGPSVTVSCLFFFPIIASSIRLINEKNQGTHERSLVAGTKTSEILVAYGCSEFIVLILQSLCVYFTIAGIFGIKVEGSIFLVLMLYIFIGVLGVSLGFCIGAFCNEEIEAALLTMALFFPNLFLSGLIWPAEGQPEILQYFSFYLPCRLIGESIRSLFSRGWPLTHPNVYPGLISVLIHIIIYFVLTVIIQRLKTK